MKLLPLLLGLTILTFVPRVVFASDAMLQGEKWVYEHEGYRPMTNPPQAVEGDRVNEVVDVKGEGEAKRWSLRHTWGTSDDNPPLLQLDAQRRLHQVDVELMSVKFDPPLPLEWPELEVGESTTFLTTLSMTGFELPIRYEANRLPDETVIVPAGTFENCRRVRVIAHAKDLQGQDTQTRNDVWFHPRAHGLVKEITIVNYTSADSYSSTSSLKSHTVPSP